jgi:DNA-binding transcriptional ArsR family regulator
MTGLDQTLTALAEPTRRRVVELLLVKPRRPTELSEAFAMSPPAMSRHLRVLRQTGLIEEQRDDDDARVRVYRLRPEPFRDLQTWLERMETFWEEQLGSFKNHVEDKRP